MGILDRRNSVNLDHTDEKSIYYRGQYREIMSLRFESAKAEEEMNTELVKESTEQTRKEQRAQSALNIAKIDKQIDKELDDLLNEICALEKELDTCTDATKRAKTMMLRRKKERWQTLTGEPWDEADEKTSSDDA